MSQLRSMILAMGDSLRSRVHACERIHETVHVLRLTRKRSRHLQRVAPLTCNFFATAPLLHPSSQPSTMRARIASACPDLGRRASSVSFSFSSAVSFSAFVG